MIMNLEQICQEAVKIARETGTHIRNRRLNNAPDITIKGKNDYVTNMDKLSEEMIVERLLPLVPDAGFMAEEGTRAGVRPVYNWIVDPIDGTTNFIHGLSPYSISIALKEHDEIIVGVVYEMGANECFYAWKNGGSWLDGIKIVVSPTSSVADSLIATGFPYNNFSKMEGYIASLRHLMQNSRGIRRLGSAATDLAYVACGRFDAFYEYNLKPHDVAAGSLLVTEAGGEVFDFNGEKNHIFGGEIIASNKNTATEFFNIIHSAFQK